jgi:uncharacterized membrane protein
MTALHRTAALGAIAAVLASASASAGTTPPSALASAGLTGLADVTGAPASPSIYEPIVSADASVIAVNVATSDGYVGYTVDAGNGWKPLPKPGDAANWSPRGMSADGKTIVGYATTSGNLGANTYAVSWKAGTATILPDLAALKSSNAWGISGDGHVIVGSSSDALENGFPNTQPVKWVDGAAPVKLTGSGFTGGSANAASQDGSVIVGYASSAARQRGEAFRWTQGGGMVGLGLLDANAGALGFSQAAGVSSDGSVVAGTSFNASEVGQAFRWTQAGGMVGLGALVAGKGSFANGISGDGNTVVGSADVQVAGSTQLESTGMVWTQGTGMKAVADFLTAKGLTVATGTKFHSVQSTNADGTVLTGEALINGTEQSYVARTTADGGAGGTGGSGGGTGVIGVNSFLDTVQQSAGFQSGVNSALTMALDGAHHRTLNAYDLPGGSCSWLTGDLGGSGSPRRRQYFGEIGLCHDYAPGLRLGFGGGYGHISRSLPLNGRASAEGYHLVGEADLAPSGTAVTLSLLGYYANWDLSLDRAYANGAATDHSLGSPGATAWAIRARIDWRDALKLGGLGLSPYLSWSHTHTSIDAYTETGGGFPVAVAPSGSTGDESRLGLVAGLPLAGIARLAVSGEWVHRYDDGAFTVAGAGVGGIAPFAFTTTAQGRDWARGGVDLDLHTSRNTVLSLSGHAVGGDGRDADLSGSASFRVGF